MVDDFVRDSSTNYSFSVVLWSREPKTSRGDSPPAQLFLRPPQVGVRGSSEDLLFFGVEVWTTHHFSCKGNDRVTPSFWS